MQTEEDAAGFSPSQQHSLRQLKGPNLKLMLIAQNLVNVLP